MGSEIGLRVKVGVRDRLRVKVGVRDRLEGQGWG